MKKLTIAIAATGLIALAACKPSVSEAPMENAADNAVAVENAGDVLDATANATSNEAVAATLENAAANDTSATNAM